MKARRNVFLVLGILFLLMQLMGYAGGHMSMPQDPAERIGYLLGYNFMFVLGLIFLLLARATNRKLKRKAEQEMLDDFLK